MNTNIRDVDKNQSLKAWWNKPLIGQKSLLGKINDWWKKFVLEEVPENSVNIYSNYLKKLQNISAIAKAINNAKFSDQEFINFVKINAVVKNNQGEYEGLEHSIDLLRVALETKDCFVKIENTETLYHSFSQQEFYDYVMELLERQLDVDEFKKLVQKKLAIVIVRVKSEDGQSALQTYVNQLDILSQDKLGLRLLYLFKQYDLSSFALLRTVAEIADSFYNKDLNNLKQFNTVVQLQSEIFLKLGEIIQVPKQKNIPHTYALMLQYIALRNRHQNSLPQFQQLISLLKDWLRYYDSIVAIVSEFPANKYKQPRIFKENIPGLDLYHKYGEFLHKKQKSQKTL